MTTPQQHLDAFTESLRAQHGVPALATVIVRDFGSAIVHTARGVRRADQSPGAAGNAILASDKFWTGSISKPMTAFLMARLAQSGTLPWTARMRDIFPEWTDPACRARLGIRDDYLDVTVEHITSHGSGLYDQYAEPPAVARSNPPGSPDDWFQWNPGAMQAEWCNLPAVSYRRLAMTLMSLRVPPLFAPGQKAGYGPAPTVAAALAERRTGRHFEDLYTEQVFGPAGMTQSSWGGWATQKAPPSGPFMHSGEGVPNDSLTVSAWCSNGPAGTMICSPRDLGRFMVQNMPAKVGTAARLLSNDQIAHLHGNVGQAATRGGWFRGGPASAYTIAHAGDNGYMYADMLVNPLQGWGVAATTTMGGTKGHAAVGAAMAALKTMRENWTALFA